MAYGVQPIAPSKRRTAFENCEHVLTPDQSHPLAAMLIPKPLQNAPHGALGVGGKLVFERRAVREHRDQSSDRPRSIARHTDIRWWCARRKRGLIRGHEGLAARWSWQFQAGAARLAEIVVRLPIRHKAWTKRSLIFAMVQHRVPFVRSHRFSAVRERDYDDPPCLVDFNARDVHTGSDHGLHGPSHVLLPECGRRAGHITATL